MTRPQDPADQSPWDEDEDVERLRLFAVTGGRVTPSRALELASLVKATGMPLRRGLDGEHQHVYAQCQSGPRSIAELAGACRQPVTVIKILVADLLEDGALSHAAPVIDADPTDPLLLERVLAGLRALKV